MITLKSPSDLKKMRESGRILHEIFMKLKTLVAPGIETAEIDRRAEEWMKGYPVLPAFKGYHDFPCVTCINVNEEVVHTIPGKRKLAAGDLMSIDCGIIYDGWYSDSAITVGVGALSPLHEKFMKTAWKALEEGIAQVRPGNKIGDIGAKIQYIVESAGFSIVRDYIGHGIGRSLHEEPEVPNFGKPGKGAALKPGMVIAIEPILTIGERFVKTLADKWTVITKDGSWAAQVEHTVAVTSAGWEILT